MLSEFHLNLKKQLKNSVKIMKETDYIETQ